MRHGSAQTIREKAREGTVRARARPRLGDDELRRGASELWDHGRGTRAKRLKRPREDGARTSARERGRMGADFVARTQWTRRRRVTAWAPERALGAGTPGAAADVACPRGQREIKPSRERESPRTDRGGRGKPANSGSLRPKSLEGRRTPGGSIRSGRTGEDVATHTLRGRRSLRKPLHRLRAVRQADRRNTSRPYRRRGGSGNP
jgi:hypothetical protein